MIGYEQEQATDPVSPASNAVDAALTGFDPIAKKRRLRRLRSASKFPWCLKCDQRCGYRVITV